MPALWTPKMIHLLISTLPDCAFSMEKPRFQQSGRMGHSARSLPWDVSDTHNIHVWASYLPFSEPQNPKKSPSKATGNQISASPEQPKAAAELILKAVLVTSKFFAHFYGQWKEMRLLSLIQITWVINNCAVLRLALHSKGFLKDLDVFLHHLLGSVGTRGVSEINPDVTGFTWRLSHCQIIN